jgi:hypothetical protein
VGQARHGCLGDLGFKSTKSKEMEFKLTRRSARTLNHKLIKLAIVYLDDDEINFIDSNLGTSGNNLL